MRPHEIINIQITPVAFSDPPLLNSVGVHEPLALRAIIEVHTASGLIGLGETYGDAGHLQLLAKAAKAVLGASPFDVGRLWGAIGTALGEGNTTNLSSFGPVTSGKVIGSVVAPFDSAFYDLQGQITGEPVWALLGGKHRNKVDFSGYLFYKWAAHPGADPDLWGEALDPAGIVRQAKKMVDEYGFKSLKLKGGVFDPDHEAAAVEALRDAFPEFPLRIDPNGAWSVETSVRIGDRLGNTLEYYEDPTMGLSGMAEVARRSITPLATNMCVVETGHIPEAVRRNSVQVILIDQHYWGGFLPSMALASLCKVFNIGVSMHSNSHLGISLAGMVHLGAAVENLSYALDTHWPWKDPAEDVVDTSHLGFQDGAITVPNRPGLGVELDREALAVMHETYLDSTIRTRNDTGYMKSIDPEYEYVAPRW
jgi:glucarate dehydratase